MVQVLNARLVVLAGGALALGLAAFLGVALSRDVGAPELGETDAGFDSAMPFELTAFDGSTVALSDYADAPVFLYFWASWCEPCRQEAPAIQRLWEEYGDRGYVFIGVNMLDNEESARAFADEFGLTFPLVTDVAGAVYVDYGVYGLPEAFFLRPGLEVDQKYIGELTEAVLRERLDAIAANGGLS
jgi:peroxiredoxin